MWSHSKVVGITVHHRMRSSADWPWSRTARKERNQVKRFGHLTRMHPGWLLLEPGADPGSTGERFLIVALGMSEDSLGAAAICNWG